MIALDTLTLPDELLWRDEFEWSDVAAVEKRTIGGKLIIQEGRAVESTGRPITLGGDSAWISRSDLATLKGWADELDKSMTLVLHDSREFTVKFRHSEKPVLQAESVAGYADPEDADQYALTGLKLVVV